MFSSPESWNSTRANIILTRNEFTDTSTIGDLNVANGLFKCSTLEDTVRRVKKFGETAIPAGLYRVVLTTSFKFGFVPHLLNVPYFEGILIHNGNAPVDTHGCILVGQYNQVQKNWIGESRSTLKNLMLALKELNEKEELWIDVRGGLTKEQMMLS